MVEDNRESKKIVIFPLFNFRVAKGLVEKFRNGFQFSNNVILRPIKKEEMNKFHKELPYFWSDGAYLIPLINSKTFVFEAEGDFNQASRLTYEVLLAMRLLKSESVFNKVYIIEEKSKTIARGCINPPPPYKQSIYQLSISEIEEMDKLVRKINTVDLDNNSPFRVACERFNRFYEERRVDDRIIDLAIAFEALFTGDITERLENMGIIVGLACSMLLGETTEDRKKIQKFLKKLFETRNGIIHKTKFDTRIIVDDKEYERKEFSIQLEKYLRHSIKRLL